MSRTVRAVTALAAVALLAACGSSTGAGGGSNSPSSPTASGSSTSASTTLPSSESGSAATGTLNVFAAASLKEAFTALGARFQAAHPGTKVVFNFGPSSGLAASITEGAPADVFASASPKNMAQVVSAGAASAPVNFASNVMEVAVPPDNPARITSLADLAKPGVKVALCQAAVPCGATAEKVLVNAKLTVRPVTREVDVKSVLAKVTLGEVDAGVVYVTDVKAAGAKVRSIEIPASVNARTEYPIAALAKAPNAALARAFTAYVVSSAGGSALAAAGFGKP